MSLPDGSVFYIVHFEGLNFSGLSVLNEEFEVLFTKEMTKYDILSFDLALNGEVLIVVRVLD